MILEALTRFSVRHGIGAFEWLQATLLILWSLIISETHRSGASAGFYRELTNIAPWWIWTAYGLLIVGLIAAGTILINKRLLYISIFGKVTYWAIMGTVIYLASPTPFALAKLLIPLVFFAFSLSAGVRYGELKYREARG